MGGVLPPKSSHDIHELVQGLLNVARERPRQEYDDDARGDDQRRDKDYRREGVVPNVLLHVGEILQQAKRMTKLGCKVMK